MSSDIEDIKKDVHSLRGDIGGLTSEITNLTKVMIRKEESDKYLSGRVEKLEELREKDREEFREYIDKTEIRIRANEDFVTKSNPWVNFIYKVLIAVGSAGALIWIGFKSWPI